jgi:hypothetical protein
MRARPIISLLLAAMTATALAACGGGSGAAITSDSASQIVAKATSAVESASSVRVAGSFTEGSGTKHTISLDLRLVAGKGATGSMSEGSGGFDLTVIGSTVYVKGSSEFWKEYAGSGSAARLAGRWLKTSSTSGSFGDLASEVRARSLLSTLLSDHGGLTKGATTTIDGRKVIAVHDASGGGTLYVATSGTPYPIELVKTSDDSKVSFSQFNAPVPLAAPAGAISTSAIGG